MQKKIAIVSIIVAIIIVISVSIGTTYSLWTTSVHQESTNTIDVGCFNISFSDENIAGAGNINLENIYPVKDDMGKLSLPYKFTITNTCSVASSYNVLLETLNNSTLDESKIKVYFNDTSVKYYVDNATMGLSEDAKNGMNLTKGYLAAGEKVTYSLKMWIDYNVTVDTPNIQGKIWNGRIVINSEAAFTKPILNNKVLDGNNVVLDAHTGNNKTVESITCYYGDKNSQTELGTAIGTTKCQYPLNAEYAKYDVSYTDGTSESSVVKKLAWYIVKDGQFLGNESPWVDLNGGWTDYYIERTQGDGYINIVADYKTALENDGCGWLYSGFNVYDYLTVSVDMEYGLTCEANQGAWTAIVIPKYQESNAIVQPIYNYEATSSPLNITLPRTTYTLDIRANSAYSETGYENVMLQIGGQGQCVSNQKIYNFSLQYAE